MSQRRAFFDEWRPRGAARRAARLLGVALGLAVLLIAGPAAAQRGEDHAPAGDLAVSSNPNDGFPGIFDTEVAPKGTFVANLPATTLMYGVTSRLTIGTITASYLSVIAGSPSASVYVRYRLGGAAWFRSTVDALLLSAMWSTEDGQTVVRGAVFASNTELVLHPRHRLTAHGFVVRAAAEPPDPSTSLTGMVFIVGATYSVSLAPWAALHVTALYVPSVTGSIDGPGSTLDLDATNVVGPLDRLVGRATGSMRRGRWLFDVGAFRAGSSFGPWFNVALQMGT